MSEAATAYRAARNDVSRLLDILASDLETIDRSHVTSDQKHWGFAGDMEQIRNTLIDLVAHVQGVDRGVIVAALTDAKELERLAEVLSEAEGLYTAAFSAGETDLTHLSEAVEAAQQAYDDAARNYAD